MYDTRDERITLRVSYRVQYSCCCEPNLKEKCIFSYFCPLKHLLRMTTYGIIGKTLATRAIIPYDTVVRTHERLGHSKPQVIVPKLQIFPLKNLESLLPRGASGVLYSVRSPYTMHHKLTPTLLFRCPLPLQKLRRERRCLRGRPEYLTDVLTNI